MILLRDFNDETHIDRIWYDSSMIIYSECYDTPNSPLKKLTVTFKNGATYEYYDVNVNDYVAFVHGGLDGSNGKALNKFVKPKYECGRIENRDLKILQDEFNRIKEEHEKKRTQIKEKEEPFTKEDVLEIEEKIEIEHGKSNNIED